MNLHHPKPFRRWLAALVAAVCLAALLPSAAQAGRWTAHVCRDGGGNPGTIVAGVPSEFNWAFAATTGCDSNMNGFNGMQIHVTDGQRDPLTEPYIPANTSGGLFVAAPPTTYMLGIGVGSGRFAHRGAGSTGFHPRVMSVNRSWCVTQGYGGAGCAERGRDPDFEVKDWYDSTYVARAGEWYGNLGHDGGNTLYMMGVVCNGGANLGGRPCYRPPFVTAGGWAAADALVQVNDITPPTATEIGGALANGAWHRPGAIQFDMTAWDAGLGIRSLQRFVNGSYIGGDTQFPCRVDTMRPCDDQAINSTVQVGGAYDGLHRVDLRVFQGADEALDCAVDCVTKTAFVRTDGTGPDAPQPALNRPGWVNTNGFQLNAPIPASEVDPDGAGWREQSPLVGRIMTVCPADEPDAASPRCATSAPGPGANQASTATFDVPSEGAWKARMALRDTVGNIGGISGWVPIQLDQSNPSAVIVEKPLAIDINAEDTLSGMSEIRYRIDGGEWQTIAGGTGTVPVPAGQHVVELIATDNAGNALGTEANPARYEVNIVDPNAANNNDLKEVEKIIETVIGGGDGNGGNGGNGGQIIVIDRGAWNGDNASEQAKLTAWYQRGDIIGEGKPKKKTTKKKTGVKLADPLTKPTGVTKRVIATKDRVVIRGRLVNEKGVGIGNARLDLLASIPGGKQVLDKGGVRTRPNGEWTLVLPRKQTSRTLTIGYRARINDEKSVASTALQLTVKAKVMVRAGKAKVGAQTPFSGSISAGHLDPSGATVSLQVKQGRKWRTFATPRTDAKGVWKTNYRFSRRGNYQMRAFIPSSPSYPYKGGASRTIRVFVR